MTIRAAILGYGRSGSNMHAGGVEHCDGMEAAAVCDIDEERRNQAAERFGCPVYDDYHAMLRSEELDLVIIVTRSDQHCAMAVDCLEAGVNVLVTKPWAVNAAEAEAMIAAQKKSGKLLLPWLPARYDGLVRRIREIIDEGALGDVFLIRRVQSSFGMRSDWQTERKYGGGYLLNWGPHIVDPAMRCMDAPPVSVYARMKQVINPGDAEDVFFALVTLADGTLVQAEYTISVSHLPEWVVQGDRGTLVADGRHISVATNIPANPSDPTQFKTMTSENEKTFEEDVDAAPYGDTDEVYTHIAAAVRGEAPYPDTPESALLLSRVFDAVRTSAEENRVVAVAE